MNKVIWEQLESEYISSDLSYSELAKKYKISKSRIAKVAGKNSWVKKRNNYRTSVAQNALSNARVLNVKKNTEKLTELTEAADKMSEFLNRIMNRPDGFYKQILSNSEGAQIVTDTEKLDTRAVKDIVTSIRDMTTAVNQLNALLEDKDGEKDEGTSIKIIEGKAEWAK